MDMVWFWVWGGLEMRCLLKGLLLRRSCRIWFFVGIGIWRGFCCLLVLLSSGNCGVVNFVMVVRS